MSRPATLNPSHFMAIVAPVPVSPLHGALPSTPVPHWAVLLVVVPALWLAIGATVLAVDRLLERFGW